MKVTKFLLLFIVITPVAAVADWEMKYQDWWMEEKGSLDLCYSFLEYLNGEDKYYYFDGLKADGNKKIKPIATKELKRSDYFEDIRMDFRNSFLKRVGHNELNIASLLKDFEKKFNLPQSRVEKFVLNHKNENTSFISYSYIYEPQNYGSVRTYVYYKLKEKDGKEAIDINKKMNGGFVFYFEGEVFSANFSNFVIEITKPEIPWLNESKSGVYSLCSFKSQ